MFAVIADGGLVALETFGGDADRIKLARPGAVVVKVETLRELENILRIAKVGAEAQAAGATLNGDAGSVPDVDLTKVTEVLGQYAVRIGVKPDLVDRIKNQTREAVAELNESLEAGLKLANTFFRK